MAAALFPTYATMTAVSDAVKLPTRMYLDGLTFQGTGLTAGQRVVVRDSATAGTGRVLADYVTDATTAGNGDLWAGRVPMAITALSIDSSTVAGTWVVTAMLRD